MQKFALLLFGLATILNGIYRYFSAEGGQTGLIFGAVMGGLAIVAGILYSRIKWLGLTLGLTSLTMTGGFFVFVLLKKQEQYGIVRPSIMLLLCLTTLVVMFVPKK